MCFLILIIFSSGGIFISICETIRLPDDVTLGFIVGKGYSFLLISI